MPGDQGLRRRANDDDDVVNALVRRLGQAEIDAAIDQDLDAGEVGLNGNLARGEVGLHLLARHRSGGYRCGHLCPRRHRDAGEQQDGEAERGSHLRPPP